MPKALKLHRQKDPVAAIRISSDRRKGCVRFVHPVESDVHGRLNEATIRPQ